MQPSHLRYPGTVLASAQLPAPSLLALVAARLKVPVPEGAVYGQRGQTRPEHLPELQAAFGSQTFTVRRYRATGPRLAEVALPTKMAEPSSGSTHTRPSRLRAGHVRDDACSLVPAGLAHAQLRHPFAAHWGDCSWRTKRAPGKFPPLQPLSRP